MSKVFRFTQRRHGQPSANARPETQSVSTTQQKIVDDGEQGLSFAEIAQRNAENQERLKRERAKANKNVLRSYRIK